MSMFALFKKQYHPLNTVEVSEESLLSNYQYLSQLTKELAIAPVLKSNAYGHGIVEVAKVLDTLGVPFFCVDSIYEGYQLLKAHVKTPILVMGYIAPGNLRVKKLPFSYAVYTEDMLDAIKKYQPHAGIHIFVDTGMHREGVQLKDLSVFVTKARKYNLNIEGLMSHFAMADKVTDEDTQQQVKNFQTAKKLLESQQIFPQYVHIAASSGVLHSKEYPEGLCSVGRAGISLYGIDPENKNKSLKPVLSLKTTITQIKQLAKGEKVGYDFTFTAKNTMKIAVLPIGYNDGVDRRLSNTGWVKVGNTFCPIIGRISMNITLIDITKAPRVKTGDEVIIYSNNREDKNTISRTALLCKTIPYELLVHLHPSTKRVVV